MHVCHDSRFSHRGGRRWQSNHLVRAENPVRMPANHPTESLQLVPGSGRNEAASDPALDGPPPWLRYPP
jgi:hypothetical protein